MWLLNAKTQRLEQFHDKKTPPYVALSHRWEDEEVSFEDIGQSPKRLKGYQKIDMCCKVALSLTILGQPRPIEYVWIDTCCIDKKSSAELSEAINSMFRWYAECVLCLAYLSDVSNMDDFEKSKWFTRGWTLQELLAPRRIHFYGNEWQYLGSKGSLANVIHHTTGISLRAIKDFKGKFRSFSIAEKMSWAAKRETTREEDIAYSLLGLFDINMPMLYGEGALAFHRLQEEIMKVSDDMSLFLWSGAPSPKFGMLAASPSSFDAATIISGRFTDGYSVNNSGLTITCYIRPYCPDVFIAYLCDLEFMELMVQNAKDLALGKLVEDKCLTKMPAVFLHSIDNGKYERVRIGNGNFPSIGFEGLEAKLGFAMASRRSLKIMRTPLSFKKPTCRIFFSRREFAPRVDLYTPTLDFSHTRDGSRKDWTPWSMTKNHVPIDKSLILRVKNGLCHPILGCITVEWKGKIINLFFGFDDIFRPVCVIEYMQAQPSACGHLLLDRTSYGVSELASSQFVAHQEDIVPTIVEDPQNQLIFFHGDRSEVEDICRLPKLGVAMAFTSRPTGYEVKFLFGKPELEQKAQARKVGLFESLSIGQNDADTQECYESEDPDSARGSSRWFVSPLDIL